MIIKPFKNTLHCILCNEFRSFCTLILYVCSLCLVSSWPLTKVALSSSKFSCAHTVCTAEQQKHWLPTLNLYAALCVLC